MIHHISDTGYLLFQMIGGNDSALVDGHCVWLHGQKRVPMVVRRKSTTAQPPSESRAKPSPKELWIEIGATSKKDEETVISEGDVATFQPRVPTVAKVAGGRSAFDNKAVL